MKFGETELKNARNGSVQISKILNGTKLIWENWTTITGASFLPITLNNGYTKTITSSKSEFNFKNPTYHCSGKLNNWDDFDVGGTVTIEAHNVETDSWVTLHTHNAGDVHASGGSQSFDFTYSDTSGVLYNQWRIIKGNGSNTATINGEITAYTKKG